MPQFLAPVVGMHFRPPAQALIQILPGECPLWLEREPENPYDQYAVKVMLASKDIPTSQHDDLSMALPQWGKSLEEVLAQLEWQLGYVDSKKTKMAFMISEQMREREASRWLACLGFLPDGKPAIRVDFPQWH